MLADRVSLPLRTSRAIVRGDEKIAIADGERVASIGPPRVCRRDGPAERRPPQCAAAKLLIPQAPTRVSADARENLTNRLEHTDRFLPCDFNLGSA